MIELEERERYRKMFEKMDELQLIKHLRNSVETTQYLLGEALSDEYTIQGIMKEILRERGVKV